MKTILCLFLCLTISGLIHAQKSQEIVLTKKINNHGIDIDTLTGVKNKKIVFTYDTVFLINEYGVKELIRGAEDLYRIKNLNDSLDEVLIDLNNIETGVNEMNSNMRTVTDFINDFERNTKNALDSLDADNVRLNRNMQTISLQLDDATNKIKAERWNSFGTKTLYGLGGFVIGGLFVMLVSR